MKAVLRYTDCMLDGQNVFRVLSAHDIEILKTKQKPYNIYPEVTIRIKGNNELNRLVSSLNRNCHYEVRVLSIKSEDGFIQKIKRVFE